jgi:predicted acylesterase/phospholipase RssA
LHFYHGRPRRGTFLDLDKVLTDFKSDRRPDKKLAVAFTGGGARGAYEGGAVEALVQAFRSLGVKPDIVSGASAGAINSLCLFTDLMYPMAAPDPNNHFLSRQSSIWKTISVGNNGAVQVVDKPWLIEYLTGKKPIPGLSNVEDAWRHLGQAWQATKSDVTALGPAAQALANALTTTDSSQLLQDIQGASANISTDITTLSGDWMSVSAAWDMINLDDMLTDPSGFVNEINSLGDAIGIMMGDAPNLIWAIASAAVQIGSDDVSLVIAYINGVIKAAEQVITQLGKIVTDAGSLAGDLVTLGLWLGLILAAVGWILTHLAFIFITVSGNVMLIDHILGNERLIGVMRRFIHDAMTAAGAPLPGHIINDWKARMAAGTPVPAFYISATNLTADRQIVLALDEVQQLQAIANEGTWVLDLASQGVRTENLFTPDSRLEDDLLPLACMTSSSIPFVFPPMKWQIDRVSPDTGKEERFSHVCVDGGVVDNTPIDLAVFAGATHIISIELTPLLDYNSNFEPADSSMDNLVGVAGRSFFTAMDGSLLRSISDVVDINTRVAPAQRCRIYRLAPVIPKSAQATDGNTVAVSPGLVDFDGVYNNKNHVVMSLFDWFMQGYVDAKGWGPADVSGAAAADPIIQAYNAAPPASGFIKQPVFSANRLWAVHNSPLPLPDDTQNMALPNQAALADAAESR